MRSRTGWDTTEMFTLGRSSFSSGAEGGVSPQQGGSPGRSPSAQLGRARSCRLSHSRTAVSPTHPWARVTVKGDLTTLRPLPGVLAFYWGILAPFSTFYFERN